MVPTSLLVFTLLSLGESSKFMLIETADNAPAGLSDDHTKHELAAPALPAAHDAPTSAAHDAPTAAAHDATTAAAHDAPPVVAPVLPAAPDHESLSVAAPAKPAAAHPAVAAAVEPASSGDAIAAPTHAKTAGDSQSFLIETVDKAEAGI